jgi:hypothetical protein
MNEFLWKSRFIETVYKSMLHHGIDLFDALATAESLAEEEYPAHQNTVPEQEAALVCRMLITGPTSSKVGCPAVPRFLPSLRTAVLFQAALT